MESDAYEPTVHMHRWAQKIKQTSLLSEPDEYIHVFIVAPPPNLKQRNNDYIRDNASTWFFCERTQSMLWSIQIIYNINKIKFIQEPEDISF